MRFMDRKNLEKYLDKFCRILIESNQKFRCLFCTIKKISRWFVYVDSTDGKSISIPIGIIKWVYENEEQW